MKMFLVMMTLLVSSTVFAGPTVSGGIVYHEELEFCKSTKNKTEIYVRAVMNPQNILAVIVEGKQAVNLKCQEGSGEALYICQELRAGEGQLKIKILRNSQGIKYAQVLRKDILQRDQVMYNMACDQQVSNR